MEAKAYVSLATSVLAVLGTVGVLTPEQVLSWTTLAGTVIAAVVSFWLTWRVPNSA